VRQRQAARSRIGRTIGASLFSIRDRSAAGPDGWQAVAAWLRSCRTRFCRQYGIAISRGRGRRLSRCIRHSCESCQQSRNGHPGRICYLRLQMVTRTRIGMVVTRQPDARVGDGPSALHPPSAPVWISALAPYASVRDPFSTGRAARPVREASPRPFPTSRGRRSGIAISRLPGFRPGQRISNAFVIRGEFPACRLSYITGAEPIGSICPIMRFTGRRRGPAPAESVMAALSHGCFKLNPPDARNIQGGFAWIRAPVRARSRDQRLESAAPLKRSMLAWRRRPIPRVMQCPRQR